MRPMDEGQKPGFVGRVVLLVQGACAVLLALAAIGSPMGAAVITAREAIL